MHTLTVAQGTVRQRRRCLPCPGPFCFSMISTRSQAWGHHPALDGVCQPCRSATLPSPAIVVASLLVSIPDTKSRIVRVKILFSCPSRAKRDSFKSFSTIGITRGMRCAQFFGRTINAAAKAFFRLLLIIKHRMHNDFILLNSVRCCRPASSCGG